MYKRLFVSSLIFLLLLSLSVSFTASSFMEPSVYAAGSAAAKPLRVAPPVEARPSNASRFLVFSKDREAERLKRIISLNVPCADKIPVLLYHHLEYAKDIPAEDKDNSVILSVEKFEEHMKFLYDNKFYAACAEELEMYIKGELVLPERSVVITFDDGYQSAATRAYPILKKYGFQASIFIVTRLIGEKGDRVFLNWSDIKKCGDVFTYHSHTHNKHKRRADGRTEFVAGAYADIVEDLQYSKEMLNTSYLAYPHGQVGKYSKKELEEAGFRMAFGVKEGYARRDSDKLELPRFLITPQVMPDRFEAICYGKV